MAAPLSCPFCGAPVEGGARRCNYCRAAVASVRCARCFHMSAPTAAYCEGCGFQLGLEPIDESTPLACPACGIGLDAFAGENGRLHDCSRCGGQFVEHPLLRD